MAAIFPSRNRYPIRCDLRYQVEYVTDRLILWAVFFVPLMTVAALLSRRKGNLTR